LIVAKPVDGKPEEDSTSTKTTLEFINKDIIPGSLSSKFRVSFLKKTGLAGRHTTGNLSAHSDETESFKEDGTTRRNSDIMVATNSDNNEGRAVKQSKEK
jgi:hypothetical protein